MNGLKANFHIVTDSTESCFMFDSFLFLGKELECIMSSSH